MGCYGQGSMRRALTMAVCTLVVLLSPAASAAHTTWTVRKGDTLTSIARRHAVTVDELRRWNDLRGDAIRTGQKLRLHTATHSYQVRKGDTLNAIAVRGNVEVQAIVALNPGLRPSRLVAGQVLQLPGPAPKTEANAPEPEPAPEDLCSDNAVQIASHGSYRLRDRRVAWATPRTAAGIKRGFDHLRRVHSKAPRVLVLDASTKARGELGHHLSHRDGRDVDITYFQRNCGAGGCPMRSVKPAELDVPRQWTLLRYWLDKEEVEFLFVDYALQALLYEHAKKQGVSEEKLRAWFQYPRPPNVRAGIIRHWAAHSNHVHVRFKLADCPDPHKGGDKRPDPM